MSWEFTTVTLTKVDMDIILDALWEHAHQQGIVLGKSTIRIQALRKKLLRTSLDWGELTAWTLAGSAHPPEST